MNNKYRALLAALLLVVLGACPGAFKPENGAEIDDGSGPGGGNSSVVIPGAGSKVVTLDKSKNDAMGTPGMRIFNISQAEVSKDEVTTQSTLGLWDDGKFHIEGYNTSFNGTFANAGFSDVSLLYYNFPFEEEFKISARVRVLRTGGVSTGKGVHFGVYAPAGSYAIGTRDPVVDDDGIEYQEFGYTQNTKGLGLFFRAEAVPQFRMYYSDQNASTTAANRTALPELTNLKINKEYIYEVARVKIDPALPYSAANAQYTFKLLDSKTYLPVVYRMVAGVQTPFQPPNLELNSTVHPVDGVTQIQMHPTLRGKVYAGVCISGSAVEVSQIKVWTSTDQGGHGMDWNYTTPGTDGEGNPVQLPIGAGNTPIFETPDTIPAYVPANFITIVTTGKAANSTATTANGEPTYVYTSGTDGFNWGDGSVGLSGRNYTTPILPSVTPSYAEDKIRFEFFKVSETPAPASEANAVFSVRGVDQYPAPPGATIPVYTSGEYVVNPNNLASGATVWARFKVVARDATLDGDEFGGLSNPEYSLLQTLPEFYFRVEVTKP